MSSTTPPFDVNALRAAFLRVARSTHRSRSPHATTDSPELRRVRHLSASESSDPSTLPATAINALRRSRVQSVLSAAEGSSGVAAAAAAAAERGSSSGGSFVDGAASAVDGGGPETAPRLRSRANSIASTGAVSLSSPLSFDGGVSSSRGSPARPTNRAPQSPPISPLKAPSNAAIPSIAEVMGADVATMLTTSQQSSPRVVVSSTHRTAESAHPPGHCPNRLRPAITSLVRKASVSSRPGSAGALGVDSSSVSSSGIDFGSSYPSVSEHAGGHTGGHAGGGDALDGASPLQRSRSRDASAGGAPLTATSPAEVALRRLQDRVSIIGGSAAFSHPAASLHTSPHASPPSSQRSPTHSPLASPSVTPAIARARIASLSASLEPDTDPFVSRVSHVGVFAPSGSSGATSPARGMTPPNVAHNSARPPELPRRWSLSTASKIPHVLTADAATNLLCAASPSSPTPCTSPNDLGRLSPSLMVSSSGGAAFAPPGVHPAAVPDVASLLSGLLVGVRVDVDAGETLKLSRGELQSLFESIPGVELAPEANDIDAGVLLSWSEVLALARQK